MARLDAAGLLVDGEEFWAAQRAQGAVATAAYAEDPTNAGAHLKRRAEARVHIVAPEPWGTLTRSLLAGAGIAEGDQAEASLSLVVSAGPLPRACHLDLLRADRPHLSVRVVEGVVTLGPFADPGRTACHRCVEVHLAETDPRRLLVLEQYADPRAGRLVAEPVDATLMTLALAWAARDIATWVEGREPATWSAIVPLTSRLEATPRRFPRHPHCGCGWGDALAAG